MPQNRRVWGQIKLPCDPKIAYFLTSFWCLKVSWQDLLHCLESLSRCRYRASLKEWRFRCHQASHSKRQIWTQLPSCRMSWSLYRSWGPLAGISKTSWSLRAKAGREWLSSCCWYFRLLIRQPSRAPYFLIPVEPRHSPAARPRSNSACASNSWRHQSWSINFLAALASLGKWCSQATTWFSQRWGGYRTRLT